MAFLLNARSQLLCAHGGRAIATSTTPRVLIGGAPALTSSAPMPIEGCRNEPKPVVAVTGRQHTMVAGFCLQAVAVNASQRITSNGAPLLLGSSVVIGAPSGQPLTVIAGQARVEGS